MPHRDQELRFIVHDSPDYYQLKISVFNDDKKTELIGETWIDLRDIIVLGGGQSDLWQNLTCRGKYAGEIRIEITYYDNRPKPEKPVAKPKTVNFEAEPSPNGQQKAPKRRPLPSDPYTGQSPAQPPQQVPDHVQTPPQRPQPSTPTSYVTNQSPLQALEYNTPPPVARHRQSEHYSGSPVIVQNTPPPARGSIDRHDKYPVHPDDNGYSPDHKGHTPDQRYTWTGPYGGASPSQYEVSPRNDSGWTPPEDDDRPPPPPAHRIRASSSDTVYHPSQDLNQQIQTPPIMRKEVLRNEAHRQSVSASSSAYPGRPVYRAYDSAPTTVTTTPPHGHGDQHQVLPPHHHSYDPAYDSHNRSMQPTVEDVPDSPGPVVDDYRRSVGSRVPHYNGNDYRQDPSPAPLNLSGRNSAASGHYGTSPTPHSHRQQQGSLDYARSDPSLSSRDHQVSPSTSQASYRSYNPSPQSNHPSYRGEMDDMHARVPDGPMRYELPHVPAALIPGVDHNFSMEISQRINEDRRHERRYTQPAPIVSHAAPPRGRQMIEQPPSYSAPPDVSQPYATPQQNYDSLYDRSPGAYSGNGPASQQMVVRRDLSPNPSTSGQQTIRRKSISPAPPTDGRRLSGVPFGPDDYDSLNPATAPKETVRPDFNEINGKIITHDGKEVDPSDHLPMESWAPEPEPREKKVAQQASTRPAPSGPQPVPASGRRPLRVREARPASAILPAAYINPEKLDSTPPPPVNTGRNRLQKKSNRASAMPVMSGALGGSSPLAPLPQPHQQHHDNFIPPRQIARASTFDYPNENHAPMYGSSPSGGDYGSGGSPNLQQMHSRGASASAPPIPAKVPLTMSGAMVPHNRGGYGAPGGGGGDADWALMEEMSRIDIGSGRARRHGQSGY